MIEGVSLIGNLSLLFWVLVVAAYCIALGFIEH